MWDLRPKQEYYRGKPDDGVAAKIIPLFPEISLGGIIHLSRKKRYKYYEGPVILQAINGGSCWYTGVPFGQPTCKPFSYRDLMARGQLITLISLALILRLLKLRNHGGSFTLPPFLNRYEGQAGKRPELSAKLGKSFLPVPQVGHIPRMKITRRVLVL